MIAAVGSVVITPWNLYKNPETIHYTLDTLGAFIGPLFGVLICHYYVVHRQKVALDDLFTMDESGVYHYTRGVNLSAVWATLIAAVAAICCVFVPGIDRATDYSWFVGCGLGFVSYLVLARRAGVPEMIERRQGSDVVVG
jgi:NCS1 family nucleobase:cation symporter-1